MQIFIKTLKGKTIVLDIEEWHTIKDIKTMIQDRDGIPFEAIRLANLGRTLSDDNKTTLIFSEKFQKIKNPIFCWKLIQFKLNQKFKNQKEEILIEIDYIKDYNISYFFFFYLNFLWFFFSFSKK